MHVCVVYRRVLTLFATNARDRTTDARSRRALGHDPDTHRPRRETDSHAQMVEERRERREEA